MSRPLAGRRIVNSRAPHQAARLDVLLRQAGAEPLPYPCIDIEPPEDTAPLDRALRQVATGEFDWLLLTSQNTVESLARRLARLDRRLPASLQVAVVGPGTAELAMQRLGCTIAHLPPEALGDSLAETLPHSEGQHVLLPQSAIAPPQLAERLRARGAVVSMVSAYRTVRGRGGVKLLPFLETRSVDAICLTSASTATHFVARLEAEGGTLEALDGCAVLCLGPRSAEAASDAGLSVTMVAEPHTLEGLVEALKREALKREAFERSSVRAFKRIN